MDKSKFNFSVTRFNQFEVDTKPNQKKNNLANEEALQVRRKLEDIKMAKELGIDIDDLN